MNKKIIISLFFISFILILLSACKTSSDQCVFEDSIADDYEKVYIVSCVENNNILYGLINEDGSYLVYPDNYNLELVEIENNYYYLYQKKANDKFELIDLSTKQSLIDGDTVSFIYSTDYFIVQNGEISSIYNIKTNDLELSEYELIEFYSEDIYGFKDDKWFMLDNNLDMKFEIGFSSKFYLNDNFVSYNVFLVDQEETTFHNIAIYSITEEESRLVLPHENIEILEHTKEHIVYKNHSTDYLYVYTIETQLIIELLHAESVVLSDEYIVVGYNGFYDVYDYTYNRVAAEYNIIEVVSDEYFLWLNNDVLNLRSFSGEVDFIVDYAENVYIFDDNKIGIFYENSFDLYTGAFTYLATIDKSCINDYYNNITYEIINSMRYFKNLPLIFNDSCNDILDQSLLDDIITIETEHMVFKNSYNYYTFNLDGSIKELYGLDGRLLFSSENY